MFGFVFVFAFFVPMMCLVFVGLYNCFYNYYYTVLMFALLVDNWPFSINKFEIVEKCPFSQYVKKCLILQC